MWFFRSISARMRLVSGAFGTAADNLANIPAVGQYLEDPFRDLQSLFNTVSYFFDSAATWAGDVQGRLDSIMSVDSVKINMLFEWPWLADPVGELWFQIWSRIRESNPWLKPPEPEPAKSIWDRLTGVVSWLASPVTSLAGGIWDQITSRDSWLKSPVPSLADGLWDAFTFANPWLGDWKFSITDMIKEGFTGWFWDFLEDWAERMIEVAGRVLLKVWEADIFPDSESRQSGQSKG